MTKEMRPTRRGVKTPGGTREEGKKGGAYIEDLIKRWMKENKASARVDPAATFERWKEIVGEELARSTRIVDVSAGELVVEVNSAPLLNELSTYYRQEILDSLHEHDEFRGIQKLRFRAGSF